jgi:hypothetical protein
MTSRTATPRNKGIAGLAAAVMASSVFIASALGSAPAANATCASFFGLGNGGGCTSTFGSAAIAIGTGATAEADGFFDTAVAVGTDTSALGFGALNLAAAIGTKGRAQAGSEGNNDFANLALDFGNRSTVFAYSSTGTGFGNIATNFGDVNTVYAIGSLNTASNLGSASTVAAEGIFENASNVAGTNNTVEAATTGSPGFNTAFAIFSNRSAVVAYPGPLALAGSVLQASGHVDKKGPGININGISFGGGSAAAPAKGAVFAGAKRTAGSAAAVKHAGKK